ncbi:ABC-type nitrate/sulfonate/bicarbonate transport system permease component [Rhodococcus sp. 27YEA15]|uniref:ABC transporter permease n=1 Tax=Rhodococcus sp. 27YEA15 TaxID=3156259 RepID=UPI003C7A8CC1
MTSRSRTVLVGRLLTLLALAAGWQVFGMLGSDDAKGIPKFTDVATSFVDELGTSSLWGALGQTLTTTAVGLALCLAIGIPAGLILASHPFLTVSSRFVIDFCRTVPPLAVIPLFLLIMGPTPRMAVALIVAVSVWPILLQTIHGVRNVEPELLSTARSFRLPLWRRLLLVVAPASMPYVFTGIRISATLSLLLTIGAELIAGVPGLGKEILLSQSVPDRMFALIIVAGLLGMLLAFAVTGIEKRMLAWHYVPRRTRP